MVNILLQRNIFKFCLFFLTLFVIASFYGDAFAKDDDVDPTGIVKIFCNVINQVTGGIGKVIAILILISMAIGLFLGKITWGLAIAVMVGMGLLFGASGVVDLIADKGQKNICDAVNQDKS